MLIFLAVHLGGCAVLRCFPVHSSSKRFSIYSKCHDSAASAASPSVRLTAPENRRSRKVGFRDSATATLRSGHALGDWDVQWHTAGGPFVGGLLPAGLARGHEQQRFLHWCAPTLRDPHPLKANLHFHEHRPVIRCGRTDNVLCIDPPLIRNKDPINDIGRPCVCQRSIAFE